MPFWFLDRQRLFEPKVGLCSFFLMLNHVYRQFEESPSHGHIVTYTCTGCKTSRRIPAPPTLSPSVDLDPPPLEPQRSIQKIHSDSQPMRTPFNQLMDIDSADANATSQSETRSTRRHISQKKKPVPRLPPLFARNAGHVVFCGNQKLHQNEVDA
jgi:hypothetical protein